MFLRKKYHLGMTGDEVKAALQGGGGGSSYINVVLTAEEYQGLSYEPVIKAIDPLTDFSVSVLDKIKIVLDAAFDEETRAKEVLRFYMVGESDGINDAGWGQVTMGLTGQDVFIEQTIAHISSADPSHITIMKVKKI